MTRSQRIFLALFLPVFAWLLHVRLCDWHYKDSVSFSTFTNNANVTSRYSIWHRNDRDSSGKTVQTGLTTAKWIDLETALIWGVFLPLALVGADIWWLLGWRRHNRLATGRRANCGYDLKGSPAANCPECGAVTDKKG